MFTTSSDALSGELTDLMSYLEAGFRQEMNQPAGSTGDMGAFILWAKGHLSATRPSEVFPVDNNYGILLTNGQRIKLCPATGPLQRKGAMANPESGIQIVSTREG
jgi:hypothetical protein